METPGLDSALAALRYWRTKHEVVSHNLANVSSPGFKGHLIFAELRPGEQPAARQALDREQGTLSETGGPLDLVIEGPGFFVVDTPAGERLTRRGSFELDENGILVDPGGHPVMGDGGVIAIPPEGEIVINDAGEITVDDELVDRLRVEQPEADDPEVTSEGASLLRVSASLQPVGPESRGIKQGFLEESNVDAVGGLTDLISIQRHFAAAQRAVETLDRVAGTIANDLARTNG
ncbi:MAG: flagellar hook basal-body protein [Gemmatimonadetes bacterium]|nr:flagellar hook basal-body protein [Gemmatimonadota bacterium]